MSVTGPSQAQVTTLWTDAVILALEMWVFRSGRRLGTREQRKSLRRGAGIVSTKHSSFFSFQENLSQLGQSTLLLEDT